MKNILLALLLVLCSVQLGFAQTHTAELGCTITATSPEWAGDTNFSRFRYVVNTGLENNTFVLGDALLSLPTVEKTFQVNCTSLFGASAGQFTLGIRTEGVNSQLAAPVYFSVDLIEPMPVPAAPSEICLNGMLNNMAVFDCEQYP